VTVAAVQAYPVVAVPLYSSGYSAGDATVQQLVQLLLSQQQRLDRLEQGGGPTVTAPGQPNRAGMPPAAPETSKTWSSCVSCHDGNGAKADGHVLFANGLPTHWDAATLIEVVDRTTRPADAKGAMPKGGPALSGEEVEAMLSEVKRMAAVAAK
jgi:mono/diheme cytochrome c family protein